MIRLEWGQFMIRFALMESALIRFQYVKSGNSQDGLVRECYVV